MSVQLDTNPLRKGLVRQRPADPCVFVIFGGTGDLARRKLLPALYHLALGGLLPRGFAVMGYASQNWTDERYREFAREAISHAAPHAPTSGPEWDSFASMLFYSPRTDDVKASLETLKKRLHGIDVSFGTDGNYFLYLAIPPFVFADTVKGIAEVRLAGDKTDGRNWPRIVVEKPFGEDLKSARELNTLLQSHWPESRIYRIDHYLGKETVQNILVFRFANEFAEPILNSKHVDHIELTVAETLGVESRGGYYDSAGALRDMAQNHLLQVLSLACMEPPSSFDPEAIRDEKSKLLRSVRRIAPSEVNDYTVRGQYGQGILMGERVPGYREEKTVDPNSITETFVALKLMIDNRRWEGVPIYLRTGKRLAKRVSELTIQLKNVPGLLRLHAAEAQHVPPSLHAAEAQPNIISINIQPDEGVAMRLQAKTPGLTFRVQPVLMDFRYGRAFGKSVPDAYERLILDALMGDPSLYPRADATEIAWSICDPIEEGWKSLNTPTHPYAPGSWGPSEADELVTRDGRKWRRL